jgi:hypothetical protein
VAQNLRRARDRCDFAYYDQAFDPESEPPLGAHLVTPRRGYTHHGIYVGQGRVVQYGGFSLGLRRGPVEEVSRSQFAQGRAVWIRRERSGGLEPDEVVRRARLRLGEDRYHLVTNNCEHFCEWCVCGEHRSYQIDALIARCGCARQNLISAVIYVLFLGQRASARNVAANCGALR